MYKQLNLEFVFGKSYLDNFSYDGRNISNVIGKISGNDSSTAIILTAHFDAWFNGAVDNASGVATVLEIAKLLEDTSKKESLNYDVIFLMTNGEMALFAGSRDFVTKLEQLQYQNIFNINIDCVGMKDSYNSNPLGLKTLSRISESQILYSGIKEIFNNNNIDFVDDYPTEKAKIAFEQNMGVSDYFAFEENDYPNIHICQQGISEFILNEKDTPELLDYKKIEKLAYVLSIYIKGIIL
nr:M28 family peptidase [Clostridium saudiense]